MDLKKFVGMNKLSQKQLAEFLGITEASVSRAINGKSILSESRIRKILDNCHGWDVSPLLDDDDGDTINHVDGNNNITINNNVDSELVKSLRKQIALLEDQVAELKKDKDELREWLKEIRGGSPSSRAT